MNPEGLVIYYGKPVDGKMKIWKKLEEEEGEQQITFDDYHDYFPHISPDGYWLTFLSYPPGIDPYDPPPYTKAMIRLVPISGGTPKVLAHLIASKGSMNVPCWSYDSQFITFVSYSGR